MDGNMVAVYVRHLYISASIKSITKVKIYYLLIAIAMSAQIG